MKKLIITTVLMSVVITGCSTRTNKNNLLPDEGPTTRQVYDGHITSGGTGSNAIAMEQPWNTIEGQRILPGQSVPSVLAQRELDALKRDFRQVPNPEILAYVYPHMTGSAPIPGYFTMFRLYDRDHFAVSHGEGIRTTRRAIP